MAYIGNKPTVGNFQICDAISVVNGQAAYTMQVGSVNVIPQSANHMIVSLNGTIQKPGGANPSFTVSGSTITFASNLVTNDVIDFIQILGSVLDLGVPSDATVTAAKIGANAVTAAKLNNDIISGSTELASAPADTDEFLISDAGVLKRIDASLVGVGSVVKLQTQTASSSSTITFTSTYITSTYKKYFLDYTNIVISSDGGNISATVSANNGTSYTESGYYYYRMISNSGTSSNAVVSSSGTNNSALLMLGTGDGLGTSTDESGSGRMTIFDPNSADSKFFISEGIQITNNGALAQQYIYQGLITSTTINNIKISPNTGTIVSGTFTLYGVKT